VELILQVDKGVIRRSGEVHVAEDGSNDIRPHLLRLLLYDDLEKGLAAILNLVTRVLTFAEIGFESISKALNT